MFAAGMFTDLAVAIAVRSRELKFGSPPPSRAATAISRPILPKVRPRDTRELVQDHVRRLELSKTKDEVTLHVDKRYAFHAINSSEHIKKVVESVKRVFGKQVSTVVQLDKTYVNREREKAVPHAIHYR